MKNFICVYDFETDSPNPHECEPVQLAACIINNITLEIMPNSEFCVNMRPPNIDDEDYFEKHESTIEWHAKNYNKSPTEIFELWKSFPAQKQGWEHFTNYLLKYNKNQSRRTKFGAPIRAGANIRRFDNIIVDRLCKRYGNVTGTGEQNIFSPRDIIDIMEICFYWFENLPEPKAYNMDTLRQFFGIPLEGSHDALKDIRDEAWIIQKFMKLFRIQSHKIRFRGAYNA